MHILWTSPHCRPDWIERLGYESQGGQTEVMFRQTQALVEQNSALFIDIYTRYQDNDFQVDKNNSDFIGKELLHYPKHCIHVKELEEGRIRIIRLPSGPADKYIPKELLYGKFINQFVESMFAFSKGNGVVYDLAHGHYADGWETVTKLSKMLKEEESIDLPTILTTHSLGRRKKEDCLQRGEGSEEELNEKYNFNIRIKSEEKSLLYAQKICALSTTEKEYLEDNYKAVAKNDSKLIVIPNGVDPQQFSFASKDAIENLKEKIGLRDKFVLLVPSRVDPRKGQLNLLKALGILGIDYLREHDFSVVLLAWPEEPTDYTDVLDRYIQENNLIPFAVKTPSIPHEQMPLYFGIADLVVIPSQEYFSIAMLEAMLLKKPLIASNQGGSRDAIVHGESGFLVNHNNAQQIATLIRRLSGMGSAQLQKIGNKARERILERYTLDAVAKKIGSVYAPLLAD